MAEPENLPTPVVRTRYPRRRLWQDILGASAGICIGAASLVLIGVIVSADVLMPSHPINRNANQTKATVLEAAISGLFSKIAARFGPADKQGTVSRRQVRNGGASLLLAYNLSVDLLEHFHLPVIDPLHDAVVNGTASDITDGASASEVADLRGANLTTESMSAVNAGDASNSTLVDQRNSSKNVAKSFLLDLENDSNQTGQ
ncbi:uncharacterized protein LOC142817703 [Rhipicephalus microplus]|uniref:uncharacterized protein LOC142817703 n=1 Tax=Rhipicephalus microplus TaxID=6941 RepID=UPI0023767C4B